MALVLVGGGVFGFVFCLVVSLFGGSRQSTMESRIQSFRARNLYNEDGEVDLELPFLDRVFRPTVEGISHALSSILPASVMADIQKTLMMAGDPMTFSAYMIFWAAGFFTMFGVSVMMFLALPSSLKLQGLLFVVLFALLGLIFPRMWLSGKVKARQKMVVKALPDAMDLITTCVEAGLGLDAALARVAEKSGGPLATELSKMLRDVAMGKLRKEAMIELEQRLGVEELTSFINSVIQAEQLGVGIAQVLRVQSDQMRTRRRQRAEKAAHEAPIKMMFPLVLFIFPAFLGVILGPAAIRIAGSI